LLCQFELLVAEVGDELEGAAECGDEAAEHVLGGASPLSIWETRATDTPIRAALRGAVAFKDEAGGWPDGRQALVDMSAA
jgi:hypothetical protein